jgi:hypothetical protein
MIAYALLAITTSLDRGAALRATRPHGRSMIFSSALLVAQ